MQTTSANITAAGLIAHIRDIADQGVSAGTAGVVELTELMAALRDLHNHVSDVRDRTARATGLNAHKLRKATGVSAWTAQAMLDDGKTRTARRQRTARRKVTV